MGPVGVALVRLVSLVYLRVRGSLKVASHSQKATARLQSVMI